jgi:hypothetical protein
MLSVVAAAAIMTSAINSEMNTTTMFNLPAHPHYRGCFAECSRRVSGFNELSYMPVPRNPI